MRTSVIIPALNEEGSIGHVLSAIPGEAVNEILVIDGGSSDSTPGIAEAYGARVIHESRRGYGQACATGVENSFDDIIIFMDADGADDPPSIPDLLEPIKSDGVDMVLGSRLAGEIAPGAMPWHQRFGNWFSAGLIRILYGLPVTDLSPYRAVRRDKLVSLDLQDMTYGYPTEMIVKAARRGWRIQEIPVGYYPRIAGRSKISGTLRGTVYATVHILGTIARYVRY